MIVKSMGKNQIKIIDSFRSPDKLVKIRGRSLRIQTVSNKNFGYYKKTKNDDFIKGLRSGSVYILRNFSEVYVGESGNFISRRSSDSPDIKNWLDALVISDYIEDFGDFNAVTRGYIEDRIWEEIKVAGNYKLLNKRKPGYDKNISSDDVEWVERDVITLVKVLVSELKWDKLFILEEEGRESDKQYGNAREECLRHLLDWTIDDRKYGQNKRWVGHCFVSKVLGKIEDREIEIAHNIAMFLYYEKDDRNIINLNDETIRKMIHSCGIKWTRKEHELSDRENIIRGYINLLDKMNIIKKIDGKHTWGKARFTGRGQKFANVVTLDEKRSFLSIAVEQHKWPHECGINPRQFARNVENILGRKQTELEWELFGSHGGISRYKYSTEEDIVYLIKQFDGLSEEIRRDLRNEAHRRVDRKDENPGQSSLMNWKKNIEYNYKYIVIDSDLSEYEKKLLEECKDDVLSQTKIF